MTLMNQEQNSGSLIPSTGSADNRPASRTRKKKGKSNIFSYISYLVFLLTLCAVVGITVLTYWTNARIKHKVSEMEEKSEQIDTDEIERIRSIANRLEVVKWLFYQQPLHNYVFPALETVILSDMTLEGFKMTRNKSTPGVVNLSLVDFNSNSEDFDGALFQRNVLQKTAMFKDAEITKITYSGDRGPGGNNAFGNQNQGNRISFSISIPVSLPTITNLPTTDDLNNPPTDFSNQTEQTPGPFIENEFTPEQDGFIDNPFNN